MDIKIKQSKLSGDVTIPPSKSFAHRALICAALSEGKSIINNIELSDDIKATLDAVKSFGAVSKVGDMSIEIEGIRKTAGVEIATNSDLHDKN